MAHIELHGNDENHTASNHPPSKNNDLLLKTGLAASGVIVTPYIGDALGISAATVPQIMALMHGHELGTAGTGLAGGINSLLSNIPYAGETLAAGGITTAVTSGIIGIGGILIGNYLDKKPHKAGDIPWGKVIKYAALTTSILIALPSILTGISVGLGYLAAFAGAGAASSAIGALAGTVGSIGGVSMATAGAGIGSAFIHLVTCGGAALSVAGAIYLDSNTKLGTDHSANIEIKDHPPIKRAEPCKIEFSLTDENGKNLTPDDLKETYTKKLHVMVVDSSLNDYHHLHPQYDQTTGLFAVSFIPKVQGDYSAWCDFKLQKNDLHVVLKNKISAQNDYNISPVIQHTNTASNDNMSVDIDTNPPLSAGKSSTLNLKIRDKSGNAVKLEPIMGAYAHLVGFSKDGETLIHCHPLDAPQNEGDLEFHIAPQKEGFTKFFLQVKTEGSEALIPFGQYIQPANIQPANIKIPTKFTHRHHLIIENNIANLR